MGRWTIVLTVLMTLAWWAMPSSALGASGRYLDPVFSTVRRDADIFYGQATHSDGSVERLRLDLYRPVGDRARNRPVVIYVHGGDNVSSPKEAARNQMVGRMFAKRGFVSALIAYRSGTDGSSQAAAWDLRAAVRWFRAHADALGISPSRIMVMGSSAGGATALAVTFNSTDVGDSGNPGYSSAVAAGIAMAAISVHHTDIGPGDPPVAMIVAQDDTPYYEQAVATCNETRAYGNVCEEFYYPSGGHPPNFWLANAKQIIEQSSQFICRNVLGPVVCHDRNGDGKVDG